MHPETYNEVIVCYDFHEDHCFPQEAQQQVKEIVEMAKKKNAHIVVENVWDYQGSNALIKKDLQSRAYENQVLLLRDVQDLAQNMNVPVTNVEYRQDRAYSSREMRNKYRISAQEALQAVTRVINKIESFEGPATLKKYYTKVVQTTVKMHNKLLNILDGKKTILQQIMEDKIAKKIVKLKGYLPQECDDIDADELILFYDSQLLNPLIINEIHELQKLSKSSCVFAIAGSFHTQEVSKMLQEVLGYELVDTQGERDEAFVPATSALDLAQVKTFFTHLPTVTAHHNRLWPELPWGMQDFRFINVVV